MTGRLVEQRPDVSRIHGGAVPREQQADYLDLSTCIDSFGLIEPVDAAFQRVNEQRSYAHYPDADNRAARTALARLCGCDVESLDVGPGAAELIWSLVRTIAAGTQARATPRLRAMTWEPCFSEFAHAVAAVGGTLFEQRWHDDPVEVQLASLSLAVGREHPALVYLCAPTSPLGQWVPCTLLAQMVAAHPDTTFIIDQSYLSLSTHAAERDVAFPRNTVLLRSLTKELGTPGVRVGYAIMDPALRSRLQTQRPAWIMGSHAQALATAYPGCQTLLAARAVLLRRKAAILALELGTLGLDVQLQDTHYFVVRHPQAARVVRELAVHHRVLVRDCASFGLPTAFRVVAHPEQTRLVQALRHLEPFREHTL